MAERQPGSQLNDGNNSGASEADELLLPLPTFLLPLLALPVGSMISISLHEEASSEVFTERQKLGSMLPKSTSVKQVEATPAGPGEGFAADAGSKENRGNLTAPSTLCSAGVLVRSHTCKPAGVAAADVTGGVADFGLVDRGAGAMSSSSASAVSTSTRGRDRFLPLVRKGVAM